MLFERDFPGVKESERSSEDEVDDITRPYGAVTGDRGRPGGIVNEAD